MSRLTAPSWGKKRIGSVEVALLMGILKRITDAPRFQTWLIKELFGQHVTSAQDITNEQWAAFEAEAYVDVAHNDLRLKPEFSAKLGTLADTFRQFTLGQTRLPGF